ncbi:MAG TPA: DUF983 domain-containing protein [Hyphomonadaceae bacterium]|nr:DUF983 domain-containing protein [Hyphomonadaceae bacterium]
MAVSPISAGLRCRCPSCGVGQLYRGFLKFKDQCDACGADFTVADIGDGASFFVMWIALIFVVPAAMILELMVSPPLWVHVILWVPAIVVVCLVLLRPFKATLFALQWKHKAGEARFHDAPGD